MPRSYASCSSRIDRSAGGYAPVVLLLLVPVSVAAQDPGAEGGPFWEMTATAVSPRVTGTSIRQVDGQTIRLGDSTPAGWTIEFRVQSPLQAYRFYASDNQTGSVDVVVRAPDTTCATGSGDVRAVLQVAALDGLAPQGFATISGRCFGAAAPGVGLNVSFTVLPPR